VCGGIQIETVVYRQGALTTRAYSDISPHIQEDIFLLRRDFIYLYSKTHDMTAPKKPEYVVILNFESGEVDVMTLDNKPEGEDYQDYIESTLDYSLSNCEWMVTSKPLPNRLNF
jgi:hypothetical protein